MEKGIIISGTKREYQVYIHSSKNIKKAVVRKTLIYKFGPLFVGDEVDIDEDETICNLYPRKNRLIRPKVANVSYAAICTSTAEPSFTSYLLEKYLTYLIYCHVTPLILFTKTDMLDNNELTRILSYKKYYETLGYKTFMISTKNSETFMPLKEIIKDKNVIFMGQTGVGKSSSLNMIDPTLERKIGEYSKALGRGKHQTKEVVLFPYQNGFIGDTPGFSSLELPIKQDELAACFPGFENFAHLCFYTDCLHIFEKKCEVKKHIEEGFISKESYENYKKMLEELKEKGK